MNIVTDDGQVVGTISVSDAEALLAIKAMEDGGLQKIVEVLTAIDNTDRSSQLSLIDEFLCFTGLGVQVMHSVNDIFMDGGDDNDEEVESE